MKKRIGAGFVLLGLLVVAGTAAQIVPMAVSPGSERGVAVVGQACPTFSWTAVDWASGYRVAVFEALGVQIPSYEEMAAGMVPALSKEIAGRALSWTPSAEEQLNAGKPLRLVRPGGGRLGTGDVVEGEAVHRGSGDSGVRDRGAVEEDAGREGGAGGCDLGRPERNEG